MDTTDRSKISVRLRRLPIEFLFALMNATAILIIVAAILTAVVMMRIDKFAGRVVATMTERVLSKIDLPSSDVLANLQTFTEEVRALGNTLKEIKAGDNPIAQARIERLKETLATLNTSIERLTTARTMLSDEAIKRLSGSVADTLLKMRDCSPTVPQAQPLPGDHAIGMGDDDISDQQRVSALGR